MQGLSSNRNITPSKVTGHFKNAGIVLTHEEAVAIAELLYLIAELFYKQHEIHHE